ncbi:butyrophilin subfamily 1 member A1-like isoform X3 [Polypterus senegalus]|uniref:butyrophilin subfamily 1 member A1-like isoform X3 n=1 Tax=Polypterus senegalus TaxID=55291 RepID=UPI001962CC4F|nr:butyrophilin subfamily 1 member A1-like isoform X3 [Polypterus senegalus]
MSFRMVFEALLFLTLLHFSACQPQGLGEEPRLYVKPGGINEITVTCKSKDWYPKPILQWKSIEGKNLTARADINILEDKPSLFEVRSTLKVSKSDEHRIICIIHHGKYNNTLEGQIELDDELFTYLPQLWCIVALCLGVLGGALISVLAVWICKVKSGPKKRDEETGKLNEEQHLLKQENVSKENEVQTKELEEKIKTTELEEKNKTELQKEQKEIEKLRNEKDNLNKDLQKEQKENDNLRVDNQKLNEDLQKEQKENDNLRVDNQKLNEANDELRSEIDKLGIVPDTEWKRIQDHAADMVLSPDTDHSDISVDVDAAQVRFTGDTKGPDKWCFVTGSDLSKVQQDHYWEVEVGEKGSWAIGLASESIKESKLIPERPGERILDHSPLQREKVRSRLKHS